MNLKSSQMWQGTLLLSVSMSHLGHFATGILILIIVVTHIPSI